MPEKHFEYITLLNSYPLFENKKTNFVRYNMNHPKILELKNKYNINSLFSNESFSKNLFSVIKWIKELVPNETHCEILNNENFSGLQLLDASIAKNNRLNCAGYAKVFNDILLSQGILSKCVWGLSSDLSDKECHVFNHVYNPQTNKWMVIDPAFGFCAIDKASNYIDVNQLRRYVKNQDEIFCKQTETIAYNSVLTKRYMSYIPKNLFMFGTFKTSGAIYNPSKNQYCYIVPCGYEVDGYSSFIFTNNIGVLY